MNSNHYKKCKGHSMPELLIGMTLGLWVIATAIGAYALSRQTWAAMAAADSLHANARAVLRNIHEQAYLAGAGYLESVNSNEFSISTTSGLAAVENVSADSLTLSHWHAVDATDCVGNVNSTSDSVRNNYKLNTHKELTCKDLNGPGSTYQALAKGVEDFQVRYAQASVAAQTIQWKSADQVSAMSDVVAIEVCIRLASPRVVQNSFNTHLTSIGCLGETIVADGHLRRVFKQVSNLRNRTAVLL